MLFDYVNTLDLIDFYDKLGWDSITAQDLAFFIKGIDKDIGNLFMVDLAMVFSHGPVKVGECLVPEGLASYTKKTTGYIEVIKLQELV